MRDRRASTFVWRFFLRTVGWSKAVDSAVGASKYLLVIWGAIFVILCAALAAATIAIVFYVHAAGWLGGVLLLATIATGLVGVMGLIAGLRDRSYALGLARQPVEGLEASRDSRDDHGPASDAAKFGVYLPDVSCTRHPLEHDDGRPLGRDATYCHLAVSSLVGESIRGCHASLTRVARAVDGTYADDSGFTRPLRLKWAGESVDAARVDVEADRPRLLDVLCCMQGHAGIASIVTLDMGPVGVSKTLGPGVYRLTVNVSAEDSPSVEFTFLAMVMETEFGVSLAPYLGPPLARWRVPTVHADTSPTLMDHYGGGTISPSVFAGPTGPPAFARPFIDEYDDAYQLRQAITGALKTLGTQSRILSDRKLFDRFDPTDWGHWVAPGDHRKFLLKAGNRFLPALQTTDTAFEAVGLLDTITMYNDLRLEALAKIATAITELEKAIELVEPAP
jgi:hypothetical protein